MPRLQVSAWQVCKDQFDQVISGLIAEVSPRILPQLIVEHRPPEFHDLGDTGGYGPHFFAVCLRETGKTMTGIGQLLRRRTVLLIAIDDFYDSQNPYVRVAVSSFLRKDLRGAILQVAAFFLKQHIVVSQDNFKTQIGFGQNFGLINYCAWDTQFLRW